MKQRIFVGSSSEGKRICDAIARQLSNEFEVVPWHISFLASHTTIDGLLSTFGSCAYGVFVLSADDAARVREVHVILPRDNVLFEAGMFMGMHGLRRTFLVTPSGIAEFRLLSDIGGVTHLPYDHAATSEDIAVAPAVHQIRTAIERIRSDSPNVDIKVEALKRAVDPQIVWPLKLKFKVRNRRGVPVTLQSLGFRFAQARPATNDYVLGGQTHNVAFRRWYMPDDTQHDQYHEVVYLEPGEQVEGWVALDETQDDAALQVLQQKRALGSWTYRTTWHDEMPTSYKHDLVV